MRGCGCTRPACEGGVECVRPMALHTDIPTRAQIERLLAARGPSLVSIYVPTSPITQDAQGDRIAFKNLVSSAVEQLGQRVRKPKRANTARAREHGEAVRL